MPTLTGCDSVSFPDIFRLDSKVVIITGASSGLGVAFASACAEMGADVALAARRTDRLDDTCSLVRAHGRTALPVKTDVTDPVACDKLVETAMSEYGRVDVLVNNAGIAGAAASTRETPEHFLSIMSVNLNGSYWCAQACGRVMKPGSSIINISSILGITTAGLPQAAYSASKAAISGLTRDLAQQWGTRKGIRVNAIAPGFFPTKMTDEYDTGYLDNVMHRVCLGRLGDPREVAATLVWLASPAGGYVTGQTIVVDGGVTIT